MARRKREDRGLEEPGDYQAYGILKAGSSKIDTVWIAWVDWDKTLMIATGFRTIEDAEAHAEVSLRRSLNRRK